MGAVQNSKVCVRMAYVWKFLFKNHVFVKALNRNRKMSEKLVLRKFKFNADKKLVSLEYILLLKRNAHNLTL